MVAEADARDRAGVRAAGRRSARGAGERAITAYYDTFRAHRALTLAWAEARSTNAEVRELWARVFERLGARGARRRSRPSARAARPAPGLPARDLAVALNSMNERVLYATFSGDGPAVAEADVVAGAARGLAAGDLRDDDATALTGDDSITTLREPIPGSPSVCCPVAPVRQPGQECRS